MKAGPTSRRFFKDEDPRGQPMQWDPRPNPVLLRPEHRAILPSATRQVSLNNNLPLLKTLPDLQPENAVTLIRVARLYQDAIWIVESEPELAWLLLISAIETAANQWKSEKGEPKDRLVAERPELVEYLRGIGGEEVVEKVAEQIAGSLGSTEKFRSFLATFLPDEPMNRPGLDSDRRLDYSPDGLRKAFSVIYGYRSDALHSGIPFPKPMCTAPQSISQDDGKTVYFEIPSPSGRITGHWWNEKKLPMHFFVFEYIARGALRKWWESMVPVLFEPEDTKESNVIPQDTDGHRASHVEEESE